MRIEDILNICPTKSKTLFVLNDPIGKESLDELLYNSWQRYEEVLTSILKKDKLLMTCRKNILFDCMVKGLISEKSNIVDIDDGHYRLTDDEKRQILKRYTYDMNLSYEECIEIIKIDDNFPLLCKIYFNKNRCQNIGLRFFKDPFKCLKAEISAYRHTSKEKYCALFLLMLFNNDLCVHDLLENDLSENKFKRALKLCGMDRNTSPDTIGHSLEPLKGFMVKKIGDTYQFYHDFVMEVIFHIFGRNYPAEIIKYSDIGFLRRRVTLGSDKERKDPFIINVDDRHIDSLAKRLFMEIFRDRILDVVLNPCFRQTKVTEAFI